MTSAVRTVDVHEFSDLLPVVADSPGFGRLVRALAQSDGFRDWEVIQVRAPVFLGTTERLVEELDKVVVLWPDFSALVGEPREAVSIPENIWEVPECSRQEPGMIWHHLGLNPAEQIQVSARSVEALWMWHGYRTVVHAALDEELRMPRRSPWTKLASLEIPWAEDTLVPCELDLEHWLEQLVVTMEDGGIRPHLLDGARRSLSLYRGGSQVAATRSKTNEEVGFYEVTDAYGYLSNFSDHAIYLEGKIWPTVEHYYQAAKFHPGALQEQLRTAFGPGVAKRLSAAFEAERRSDWRSQKVDRMQLALWAKFTQHPDLLRDLLSTGKARLVERAADDPFWGDGADGSGENMLGQLLMKVRDRLRGGER